MTIKKNKKSIDTISAKPETNMLTDKWCSKNSKQKLSFLSKIDQLPTFEAFEKEALANEKVMLEYERLKPEFELVKRLIEARKKAGLTQEEVAKRMKTKRPNIARLEGLGISDKPSPTLATLMRYADALGYHLDIRFIKNKPNQQHNHPL